MLQNLTMVGVGHLLILQLPAILQATGRTQKIIKYIKYNDQHISTGMHSASTPQWQPTTMLGTVTLVLLFIIDSYVY
jgi:hypothetical protein